MINKKVKALIAILFVTVSAFSIDVLEKDDNSIMLIGNIEALATGETITIDCDDWFKETCATLVINGTTMKIDGRRK